ncbi:thioredoxin reductase [Haloferax mucosum ATCC BAA-1512]|uniref:Thioredoxin reductase n=1 Tax=Haloferax mucosum ATCC BAA-1512 TaxID=662479 RepID=M0IMN9_9EURY|nr:FAD-binding protein [Haloferax mucosum]ELZ98056.1 thioredoxin reductase [Haloferax mucosum ATCC BAA-1512]
MEYPDPRPTAEEQTIELSDAQPGYDVLIIGGGPAGSSAGVFTARAELETLIVEDGRSTLRKCAHLENYLGFPAGVNPSVFRTMMRDHTATSGCDRLQKPVTAVSPGDDTRFAVEVEDTTIRTDIVLITSWSRIEYLEGFDVETTVEDHGDIEVLCSDDAGRTTVTGLYAAGRIAREPHQAIVNAGAGARTARTIIEAERPEFYNDWVVPEGYYESWNRTVPPGVEEISHEERKARERRSEAVMQSYFARDEDGRSEE